MAAFLIFSKICKKSVLLADIIELQKYLALAFIYLLNAWKRQQGSGKFRLQKLLLHDEWAVENAASPFSVY